MSPNSRRNQTLSALLTLSSGVNLMGGVTLLVLVATGATAYAEHRYPPIAIAVGGILVVQALLGFVSGGGAPSAERVADKLSVIGAQLIFLCAGIATLWYAVFYNARASNGGVEPGPVLAGLSITANAILAIALISWSTPPTRARGPA